MAWPHTCPHRDRDFRHARCRHHALKERVPGSWWRHYEVVAERRALKCLRGTDRELSCRTLQCQRHTSRPHRRRRSRRRTLRHPTLGEDWTRFCVRLTSAALEPWPDLYPVFHVYQLAGPDHTRDQPPSPGGQRRFLPAESRNPRDREPKNTNRYLVTYRQGNGPHRFRTDVAAVERPQIHQNELALDTANLGMPGGYRGVRQRDITVGVATDKSDLTTPQAETPPRARSPADHQYRAHVRPLSRHIVDHLATLTLPMLAHRALGGSVQDRVTRASSRQAW